MIKCIIDNVFVKAYAEKPSITLRPRTEVIVAGDEKHQQWLKNAKVLQNEIKRHCDDYSDLETDVECHYECSFCGSQVVDKDDYECCNESITEREQTLKAQ